MFVALTSFAFRSPTLGVRGSVSLKPHTQYNTIHLSHTHLSQNKKFPLVFEDGDRVFTRAEVMQHNKITDAWVIVDMNVYNITSWIAYHPGGEEVLKQRMGKDITNDFYQKQHSHVAYSQLEEFRIGKVKERKRYTVFELQEFSEDFGSPTGPD